ncbi:hypothetical protein V8G54_033055 [Vigna mungo]|uniref:Uncharacterized protein n=1 Tax=Vigna mungo TaxID=3915 RepID=A0AAQ3MMR6_VIGMU
MQWFIFWSSWVPLYVNASSFTCHACLFLLFGLFHLPCYGTSPDSYHPLHNFSSRPVNHKGYIEPCKFTVVMVFWQPSLIFILFLRIPIMDFFFYDGLNKSKAEVTKQPKSNPIILTNCQNLSRKLT